VALANPSALVSEMVQMLLDAGADLSGERGLRRSHTEQKRQKASLFSHISAQHPSLSKEQWSEVLISPLQAVIPLA